MPKVLEQPKELPPQDAGAAPKIQEQPVTAPVPVIDTPPAPQDQPDGRLAVQKSRVSASATPLSLAALAKPSTLPALAALNTLVGAQQAYV